MRFFRQEYCSQLPFPPLGIFPTQGSNTCLLYLLNCRQILYPSNSIQMELFSWWRGRSHIQRVRHHWVMIIHSHIQKKNWVAKLWKDWISWASGALMSSKPSVHFPVLCLHVSALFSQTRYLPMWDLTHGSSQFFPLSSHSMMDAENLSCHLWMGKILWEWVSRSTSVTWWLGVGSIACIKGWRRMLSLGKTIAGNLLAER